MDNKKITPLVALIMGSQSDWETMKFSEDTLLALKIPFVSRIISAHRTPERMYKFASEAQNNNFKIIIAGAGGAAHLPGMVASHSNLPVLGVPIESSSLKGMDSLLSIVQMPGGVPVATMSIGKPGAINAAVYAAKILSLSDQKIKYTLTNWLFKQTSNVPISPNMNND